MNALLLALLLGQFNCAGNSCSISQPTMSAGFAAPQFQYAAAPVQDMPMMKRYGIVQDGLHFTVEGWILPGNGGKITWEPQRPFNATAWAEAKADQRAETVALAATQRALERSRADGLAKAEQEPIRTPIPAPKELPPVAPVVGQAPNNKPPANYGISPERMFKTGPGERYTASTDEARRFIVEAKADSESGTRLHLTVIGPPADVKVVLDDLKSNPALVKLQDRLFVQDYPEGHWAIDPKLGFPKGGKPAIVLQLPKGATDKEGGRVVLRKLDYSMGPEGLAEAIRKADPNYDPNADPGVSSGSGSCPLGFRPKHIPYAILAVVVVVAILTSKRKGA